MTLRWKAGQQDRSAAAGQLKAWTREILRADDDLAISVAELDCAADLCCGGKETVLGLFFPDRTERVRIPTAMDDVHPFELMFALWAAGFDVGHQDGGGPGLEAGRAEPVNA